VAGGLLRQRGELRDHVALAGHLAHERDHAARVGRGGDEDVAQAAALGGDAGGDAAMEPLLL
jgi:hypothetical protein